MSDGYVTSQSFSTGTLQKLRQRPSASSSQRKSHCPNLIWMRDRSVLGRGSVLEVTSGSEFEYHPLAM